MSERSNECNCDYDWNGPSEDHASSCPKAYSPEYLREIQSDDLPTSSPIFSGKWDDLSAANPIADIRAMAEHIAATSSYKPTTLMMSTEQKRTYERWTIWFEETKKRLDLIPRRRYLERRILERQLYGHPTSTSLHRWFWSCVMHVRVLRKLRYRIHDWRRDEYDDD